MNRERRKFLKTFSSNVAASAAFGLASSSTFTTQPLSSLMSPENAEPFRLAQNGSAQASIVLPDSQSPVLQFAAEELRHYIQAISSATPIVSALQPNSSDRRLVLGTPSQLGRLLPRGEKMDWPAEGTDEFSIRVNRNLILLCGGSERATLFATYQLLENLGCRWLGPGQNNLPRRETIEIAPGSKKYVPAMKWRILNVDTIPITEEFIDWFAKQKFNILFPHPIELIRRMSPQQREAFERRGLSMMAGGHSPVRFLPIEEYGEAHPEWFSLIDGRRSKPGDWPWKICHSNAEAVRTFNQNCIEFLKAFPSVDILAIWENDSYTGWCECAPCRALEPDPDRIDPRTGYPDRSATYCRWVKQVADAIHQQIPNKEILFGPYYNMLNFPGDPTIIPPTDSLLQLDDYKQCYRHSLGDPCNVRKQTELIRDWEPHFPQTTAWLYYHTRVCGIPVGLATRISKDMRYLASQGVNGFLDDMCILQAPNLNVMFGQDRLSLYILAKFSWDPSLDLHQVMEDFTQHCYGPAAGTMLQFHELLDATTYGFGEGTLVPDDKTYLKEIHTGFFMSPRTYIPNRARLEELKSLTAQALEKTTDDSIRQRIQPLLDGMQVAEYLWDAEMLPPKERMSWFPKIRELAEAYLQPQYDPELSYGDPVEVTRLQKVIDAWMKEAAKD